MSRSAPVYLFTSAALDSWNLEFCSSERSKKIDNREAQNASYRYEIRQLRNKPFTRQDGEVSQLVANCYIPDNNNPSLSFDSWLSLAIKQLQLQLAKQQLTPTSCWTLLLTVRLHEAYPLSHGDSLKIVQLEIESPR
ncbi:hypothetical protein J6590_096395, partial [Homalodisca vitripennis]